jgi:hypothetical protein
VYPTPPQDAVETGPFVSDPQPPERLSPLQASVELGQLNPASPNSNQKVEYFCDNPSCLTGHSVDFKSEASLAQHHRESHGYNGYSLFNCSFPNYDSRATHGFVNKELLQEHECR